MFNVQINWLAILASGVAYMIVGFFWYGPLFAKPRVKLTGNMAKIYITSFITALITAYVTNILIVLLNVITVGAAASLGGMLWLGYVAATYTTQVLYEDKPFKLYLINIGYYLVTIVATCIILTLWV